MITKFSQSKFPNLSLGSSQTLDFPQPAPEIEIPLGGELLFDTATWINRMTVPSDTTNAEYIVAQHRNKRFWACSCKGFTGHKKCKHLARLGLPWGMQSYEARIAITAQALPKVLLLEKTEKNDFARPRRHFALPEEDV